jgi:hypothetical protein
MKGKSRIERWQLFGNVRSFMGDVLSDLPRHIPFTNPYSLLAFDRVFHVPFRIPAAVPSARR